MVAGGRVQQAALLVAFQQPQVGVLAVDFHQLRGQFLEGLQGGGPSVDEGP